MAANPAVWSRELAQRFEELIRLINEEERRWIEFTEQLESLSKHSSHP